MNCPKEAEKKTGKATKRNHWIKAAIAGIAVFFTLVATGMTTEKHYVYKPDYERLDLDYISEDIEDTEDISEQDYEILFKQTGLGKSAVNYIFEHEKDVKTRFENSQEIFFDGYPYTCVKIGMFTYNERMRDENGKKIKGYSLVDLRQGDVLVSLSTHTLGYRHGHVGIVINSPKVGKEAKTVEAAYWGKPTECQTTKKWRYCPTLIHLRISEEAAANGGYTQKELGKLLAKCAEDECVGVSYGLVPEIYNRKSDTIKRTHCSHLIWYIFGRFGFDVDGDGGVIVTPYDIATSDIFEIVQIYGINPGF